MERGRWLALGLLCASQLMVILDGSIVAVALPVIGTKLDLDGTGLAWVVNGYLVVFGGLLLVAGRLGDLVGPRRVLLGGLAVFTAASAWCGLASSAGELIAARIVQGAGAALASSVVLGMIVTLFRGETERRRALAVFSFVGAGGSSIGLLAGGLLTQGLSWRWIFLVNVPIGATALVGVRLRVPKVQGSRGRLDVVDGVLATGGLMAAVYGLLATGLTSWVVGHPRGRCGGASWRVLLASGQSGDAAVAAAAACQQDHRARQPGAGAHGGRSARFPVPGRGLPGAAPRL